MPSTKPAPATAYCTATLAVSMEVITYPARNSTQKMLRIVVLVYLIPVVLFLAGYVITSMLTASVGVQYAVAGIGFVLGIVFAIFYDRRLRARVWLSFNIVRLF